MTQTGTFLRVPGDERSCSVLVVHLLSRRAALFGETRIPVLCRSAGQSTFGFLWSKSPIFFEEGVCNFFLNIKQAMILPSDILGLVSVGVSELGWFRAEDRRLGFRGRLVCLLLQNLVIVCRVSLGMAVKIEMILSSLKYWSFCTRQTAFWVVVWALWGRIPLAPVQVPWG